MSIDTILCPFSAYKSSSLINVVMQIPWDDNDELLSAWRDARTGFPWIDAIMTQVNSLVYRCSSFQYVALFLKVNSLSSHFLGLA